MRMMMAAAVAALVSGPVRSEPVKVEDQGKFVQLVNGKTLTRPLVRLTVSPDGRIEGRGSLWNIQGTWSWQDGYFCRDLFWGGDALGYNCQEVRASADGRIRFTSDRGAGDSAEFSLR